MEVVICIPGNWKDKYDLQQQNSKVDDPFSIENDVLLNTKTNQKFDLVFNNYDENLEKAFEEAGSFTMNPDEIKEVDNHEHVLYVLANIENNNDLKGLMLAVSSIINSGGIAVKIESSGVAHSGKKWLVFTKTLKPVDLFQAFVTICQIENKYISFGMHILGLPDAELYHFENNKDYEYSLMRNFLFSHLINGLPVENGQLFFLYEDEPKYSVQHKKDDRYPEDDLFYNKFGIWSFTKI